MNHVINQPETPSSWKKKNPQPAARIIRKSFKNLKEEPMNINEGKKEDRELAKSATKDFLKKGGKIKRYPEGHSGLKKVNEEPLDEGKAADREMAKKATADFLKKGGKIKKYPEGHSGLKKVEEESIDEGKAADREMAKKATNDYLKKGGKIKRYTEGPTGKAQLKEGAEALVDAIYSGKKDIRESLNSLLSEKAYGQLQLFKQATAKNFFGRTTED